MATAVWFRVPARAYDILYKGVSPQLRQNPHYSLHCKSYESNACLIDFTHDYAVLVCVCVSCGVLQTHTVLK